MNYFYAPVFQGPAGNSRVIGCNLTYGIWQTRQRPVLFQKIQVKCHLDTAAEVFPGYVQPAWRTRRTQDCRRLEYV